METLTREHIAQFQLWCLGRGRSQNTAKSYSTDLRMFFDELDLYSVETKDYQARIAEWMSMNRRVKQPKTLNRRMASAREFGYFAGLGKVLEGYNLPSAAQAEPHPLPGGMADLQKLLDLADSETERALVAMLGLEGMRIAEAMDLKPEDIDFVEEKITIWGKGDKVRVIPLTERAKPYIIPLYLTTSIHRPGTKMIQLSDRGARMAITGLGKKARLSRLISSHDLRATCATLCYEHTKDSVAVQALLGHADPRTTAIYIAVGFAKLREAAAF